MYLSTISNLNLAVYPNMAPIFKNNSQLLEKSKFIYRYSIQMTYFHIVTDAGHFFFQTAMLYFLLFFSALKSFCNKDVSRQM